MNTLTKVFSSLLVLIVVSFVGCGNIIPDKFYGYVPENVFPSIKFTPTDTLPSGVITYDTEESILVINKNRDTVKVKYNPEYTSDLIVYKGKHPETINCKVNVVCYLEDDEWWLMSASVPSK